VCVVGKGKEKVKRQKCGIAKRWDDLRHFDRLRINNTDFFAAGGNGGWFFSNVLVN